LKKASGLSLLSMKIILQVGHRIEDRRILATTIAHKPWDELYAVALLNKLINGEIATDGCK